MTDLLDRIRSDVHERVSELGPLVAEHERLQAALRALDGVASAAPGDAGTRAPDFNAVRVSARAARTAPRKRRAARGANRQAVLVAVRERPGASVGEIAAVSGVERSALYGVLRRLAQDGEIQARELPTGRTGYAPASPQPTEPFAGPGKAEAANEG